MERSPSSRSLPSLLDTSSNKDAIASDVEAETQELLEPLLERRDVVDPKLILSEDSRNGEGSPYLEDLHKLSFAFLFIFLAYSAVQNLESSINTDQGLGATALGILYLSLMISSLGAPMVVLWLGSKNPLFWVFWDTGFSSVYTLPPAAVFLGFTASVLWVAEGTYLTFAARKHAAVCHISEATVIGSYNGEFWGVYSFNQVVGNLVTLAVLQLGKEADPAAESPGTARIFVPFLASLTVGTILVLFLRNHSNTDTLLPLQDEKVISHVAKEPMAKASFALLCNEKSLLLCFLLFYSGMQQAFIWGDFTKDVITSTLGLSWIGGIMAVYGAADSFGSREVDYVIIFCAAIGWGLGDAAFNTQISALLGLLYPGHIEAAFAQWKIWKSAAISVVFFASSYTDFTTKLCILFFSLLVSMGFFFMAILKTRRAQ